MFYKTTAQLIAKDSASHIPAPAVEAWWLTSIGTFHCPDGLLSSAQQLHGNLTHEKPSDINALPELLMFFNPISFLQSGLVEACADCFLYEASTSAVIKVLIASFSQKFLAISLHADDWNW